MTLKLSETLQRVLISTTSRFIAEYEAEGLLIAHAWPQFRDGKSSARLSEGPLSRNAFVVSFQTPEVQKAAGVVIPNYDYVGETVCALLSVFFGKRFDNHGAIESNGFFSVPNLTQFSDSCIFSLPQNDHKPRPDIGAPLDLREARRIEPALRGESAGTPESRALNAAARFYCQALQTAETDPEVSYLHLITAGEILSNAHHPENEDLLDESVKAILADVRRLLPKGNKAAKALASQMRQIKRRFRSTVGDLVDEKFFVPTASQPQWKKLSPNDLVERTAAAYDLRSRYVHTGLSFGGWISPVGHYELNEVQLGRPVVGDAKLADLLAIAPTYLGLERIIRYCLFRFAERRGLFLID